MLDVGVVDGRSSTRSSRVRESSHSGLDSDPRARNSLGTRLEVSGSPPTDSSKIQDSFNYPLICLVQLWRTKWYLLLFTSVLSFSSTEPLIKFVLELSLAITVVNV